MPPPSYEPSPPVQDLLRGLKWQLDWVNLEPEASWNFCGIVIPKAIWEMAILGTLEDLRGLGALESACQILADWREDCIIQRAKTMVGV